jgi:HipA-like kinase
MQRYIAPEDGTSADPATYTRPMLRSVTATRYVTPLREGGSVPALVEADDDGLYVVKLLGAGHGRKALVAELLAGEIGRHLGLPVPDQVLVELDPALANAEPDQEIQDLLERSAGTNIGLDFLPGALAFAPAVGPAPEADLAAAVVWLDAFTTNVDRTPRNPNLIVWHRRLHLIDHGSALYIHHTWRDPAEHARRPFEPIRDHVLLPFASSIEAADARLAALIDRTMLETLAQAIPDDWLRPEAGLPDPAAHRRAYVDYLVTRLETPRAFVEEAERARAA